MLIESQSPLGIKLNMECHVADEVVVGIALARVLGMETFSAM